MRKRRHEAAAAKRKAPAAETHLRLAKGKRLVYGVAELVPLRPFTARCAAGWRGCFLHRSGGAEEVGAIKVVIVGANEGIVVIFFFTNT